MLVAAGAALRDVVSFDIYEPRIDPNQWAFLNDLKAPCVIGEFEMAVADRGMFDPGPIPAPNSQTRAQMYQDYVDSVLDHPAFVGCHWFQYRDEPLTGRALDGENSNIGLVSVTDAPYPELVAAARAVHSAIYRRRYGP
jgi:hypothetical protein